VGGGDASAKAALQRGHARLRELAHEPVEAPEPTLAEADRSRLVRYVESFKARYFGSLRLMLVDDVQLDLVNRFRANGRDKVGAYLHRCALADQWRFEAGLVDGAPAMFVSDRHDQTQSPVYLVALYFAEEAVRQPSRLPVCPLRAQWRGPPPALMPVPADLRSATID
jgi:RNA polymerase sigma-70 factor (ECF subfamily)